MVEDSSIQSLISWAKEGDMFYVHNCIKLSDVVLPKFFKHNNWQSFVRQLNSKLACSMDVLENDKAIKLTIYLQFAFMNRQ
ncbi:MAG: HSF-type DNA-binding-domain-containing protein [Benniella sp.]|nr:MAG: HSF-type DNA-binding-domain-containing protein [Benniella sp.]